MMQPNAGTSQGAQHQPLMGPLQSAINSVGQNNMSAQQPSSHRAAKQSNSKPPSGSGNATTPGLSGQPMIMIQQTKPGSTALGSFKIKKEDLKLLQQYCENDLSAMDVSGAMQKSKNAQHAQQISHQKTKSEGATPLGQSYVKAHYHGGKPKMQPIPLSMINQNAAGPNGMYQQQHSQIPPQSTSPFLDYQKYLEDEKIFQNNNTTQQKAKSQMGYYSMGPTPQNLFNSIGGGNGSAVTGQRVTQQSKSPDLSMQIKAAHYKSQKHHQNILAGGSNMAVGQQPVNAMISQSALSNYSLNVQNLMLNNQQNSNRGVSQPSTVTRPSSRKKGGSNGAPNVQNLIYDQQSLSMYYNGLNPPAVGMYKNASAGAYSGKNAGGSTIEGVSKDHLNESSNYLSDHANGDPLMKANQQHAGGANTVKAKHQQQYSSLQQDESYMDVYEQFIQGPHNISQFTAGGGGDINSYSHFIQRPLSQNTNIGNGGNKGGKNSGAGRQSPSQKNNTTRTATSQMNNSQNPKKSTQRTAGSMLHTSLNNSGQKQQQDRRLVVGRTPSPNFLKRIAGLMNIGNDFMLPQYKQQQITLGSNLIGGQNKRSQSKQAFSSNPQQMIPIQQNFIHMGSNTIQSLDKSLKQKFMKQQQQQIVGGSNILSSSGNNNNRFKSGSLTTSANTAQNSPRRVLAENGSSVPLQRNQSKQAKTTTSSAKSNYNTDFQQISEAIKKNAMLQQQQNPNQKLKIINEMEEKKALALVKGIPNKQASAYQQYGQFHQPVKMIGEIMEEDPQPINSQDFIDSHGNPHPNLSDDKSFHSSDPHNSNYYPGHQPAAQFPPAKGKLKGKLKQHMMVDGGTGSNGPPAQQHDAYATQPKQLGTISSQDNNSISLYLEQLQSMRQGQKSQLAHHTGPILTGSNAMSPNVNKTSSQFYQKGKQMPPFMIGGNMPNPQGQIHIKPLLQKDQQPTHNKSVSSHHHAKSLYDEESTPLSHAGHLPGNQAAQRVLSDSNRGIESKGSIHKKNASEPPKIATPSVEMYRQQQIMLANASAAIGMTEKLSKPDSQQKKQVINFNLGNESSNKTPFEKELDQKATEIKNQKKFLQAVPTQEQIKLQKYKEDSISILKQLQESGSIVIQDEIHPIQSKKNSVDTKKQEKLGGSKHLVLDMASSAPQQPQEIQKVVKKKSGQVINISGPAAGQLLMDARAKAGINSPKQGPNPNRPQNTLADEEDDGDQILLTQEEEQQIRNQVSDLNHKAFYGKVMKKTKEVDYGNDEQLRNLSPRSREILTVQRMIKGAFELQKQPPVTTTDFYRIGKMLGRGAFGKVNLAMHKLVRKLVAIKSLNKECLTDEAQKQKLMKEVGLLLKLRHNHVVKIYETIETEKHIIIVMELCAGGDLLNYVRKRRRLKEPHAKVIFKQIIDGLCYIHSKFIAHRDIKLDNILLDGKGNVKIGDFGVSKQCQKGQLRMTEQCGTPAYIAPEILKDKGYTFSVDIWSAGVVLFAMLYGTVPFKANNMEELHKLIVKGKYVLKDDISIEARNLLRGLLEVNPEKRLTIKQIYRHKWFADLDPSLQLFNDQERDMIRKEYTYNDPRRYNRNENEEPVDCFTEHNLESVYNSLKNVTSKSIILAPFNSTQSQIMEEGKLRESVSTMVCEKMIILKFARRCREIDRQYEFNNNGELDNGVYHKFINNSEEGGDDSGDERANMEDVDKELLCVPMLMSTRRGEMNRKAGAGRSSIDNSFEEDNNVKRLQDKQALALKIKESSALQKEIHRNRKNIDNEIDPEMVETFEAFQQARYSDRIDQDKVTKLIEFGYPADYVSRTLEENEPNYCTAGYYLMGMDQNYC